MSFINSQRPDEMFPDVYSELLRRRGLLDEDDMATSLPADTWFTEYQGRETEFAREVMGVETKAGNLALWEAQEYVINALFEHKFVCVYSCRKSGKTFNFGVIGPTFFYTSPSRVIYTGPTMRQIEKGAWAQTTERWNNSRTPLSGRLMSKELRLDDQHYAICIPSKRPEHLRGWHAGIKVPDDPNLTDEAYDELIQIQKLELETAQEKAWAQGTRLLVIIDEPEAVPDETFRVLQGMFNADNVYCIMQGNPTLGIDEDHEYSRIIREPGKHRKWHTVKISAFSEEEFPDPVTYDKVFDRVPPYVRDRKELVEAREKFSESDPIFMADYLGQAPRGATSNLVIPRSALESAVLKWGSQHRPLGPKIGVDIGTGGGDPCVASLFFDGRKLAGHKWFPEHDDLEGQTTTAGIIQGLMVRWGKLLGEHLPERWNGDPVPMERVSIDVTGNVAVADIMARDGLYVDRVVFSESPTGQWGDIVGGHRFLNVRTEMHWVARCGLQHGVFVIDHDAFPESWDELTWTRFERTADSKGPLIKLEPKDKVKQRHHGRSPDTADADLLGMREPVSLDQLFGGRGEHVDPRTRARESSQPIINNRLRPTKLAGAKRLR